jgi:hypothetical protein
LVKHEMEWTVNAFKFYNNLWDRREKESTLPGWSAYASKMKSIYNKLHQHALEQFGLV